MFRKIIIFLLISMFFAPAKFAALSNDELNIVLDLIEILQVRHCIFFQNETDEKPFLNLKKLSMGNLMIQTMNNQSELANYITYYDFQYYLLIILKDDDLSATEKILLQSDEEAIYSNLQMAAMRWLVFTQESQIPYDRLSVRFNTEFIIVQPKTSTGFTLTEFYKIRKKSFTYNFGKWDRNLGFIEISDSPFYSRRRNLNGTGFKIDRPNGCYGRETSNLRNCKLNEIFEDFASVLNFRLITADDPNYPEYNFFYSDIIAGGNVWRASVIDNKIGPIYKSTYNWFIKREIKRLSSDYYTQPFEIDYWLAVGFSLIIGTILVLIIQYGLKRAVKNEDKYFSIGDLFVGLETFCNQSGNEESESISFRIVSISFRIIAIFTIASYGAVITSFLAFRDEDVPFTNYEEFFKAKDYKVIMNTENAIGCLFTNQLPGEFYENLVMNYTYGVYSDDLETFRPYLQDVCNEKFAIALFDNDAFKLNPPCELIKIDVPRCEAKSYLLFETLFPPAEIFKELTWRFHECGVFRRMQNEIKDAPIQKVDENVYFEVEMEQMIQVVMIPFVGVGISIIFFIFELFYKIKFGR